MGRLCRSQRATRSISKQPQSFEFCSIWSYRRCIAGNCCSPSRERQNPVRTWNHRPFMVMCVEGGLQRERHIFCRPNRVPKSARYSSITWLATRSGTNGWSGMEWLGMGCWEGHIWCISNLTLNKLPCSRHIKVLLFFSSFSKYHVGLDRRRKQLHLNFYQERRFIPKDLDFKNRRQRSSMELPLWRVGYVAAQNEIRSISNVNL